MATDFDDQDRPARGGIGLAVAALAPILTAILVVAHFRSTPPPEPPTLQLPKPEKPNTELVEWKRQSAPAFLAFAREKLAAGDLEAARRHAESATAADPTLVEAQLTLGQVLACRKQFRAASRALSSYLDRYDGEAHSVRQLFELCQRGELAGDSSKLTTKLATTLGQMGMLAQAEALLDDMSRIPYLYGSHLRQAYQIRSSQTVARLNNGEIHIDLRGLGDRAADVEDLLALAGMRIHVLFAPQLRNVRDLSVLRGMPLRELTLEGANVHDISPLQGMALTVLNLHGCPIDSLHPISEAKLERLNIWSSQVSDLTPLRGMPLHWLELSSTKVWDLTQLTGMPLTHLMIIGTQVADLAPIADCPLEHLDIRGTKITDLSAIADMRLRYLAVNECAIESLAPLAGQPIEILGINPTTQLDLSIMESLPKLRELVVSKNHARVPLAHFRRLRKLVADLNANNPKFASRVHFEHSRDGRLHAITLERADLRDISPLKGITMNELRIFDNPVEDISALAGMQLRELLLIRTAVTDIEPLREMHNLRTLSVANSRVSDLSPLAGKRLQSLSISDTQVTDLSPLAGMTSLRQLAFSPARAKKGVEAIRELRSIESIGPRWENRMPAPTFWKRYDAGEFTK
jgi:Leucine-rich repeat (LRR) protein